MNWPHESRAAVQMLILMQRERGGKKRLTLGIQACVCARHVVQTGSEPGSRRTRRLYQRRRDGIHSVYHPSPGGDMKRGRRTRRRRSAQSGRGSNSRGVRIIQILPQHSSLMSTSLCASNAARLQRGTSSEQMTELHFHRRRSLPN